MSTEKEPSPSKKKKTLSQKKDAVKSADKLNLKDGSSINSPQISEIISQAFKRFYAVSVKKQNKVRDLQHLDVIVAEYLQTFMILGYDINGEKICISHASTPAARDALIEHLRSTFLGIMNNNNGEG
jgi:hypothetical protein